MKFPIKIENFRRIVLAIALPIGLTVVTIFELQLPRATSAWVLYIPLITLTLFFERPKIPLLVATICSAWLFIDLFFIEGHPISSTMIIRRAIGALAFYMVALIVRQATFADLKLKQFSNDLSKEREKLARSNRELEQFAGVAAHDLRSPIKTIRSWADMLSSLLPPPRSAEVDQALTIVQKNAKKADDLVEDVLAIARVDVSPFCNSQVNLNQALREIVEVVRPEIEAGGAKIHISLLPTVSGNQTYLSSVFSNLIRNALIYKDKTRDPEISIGCNVHGNMYEFFVKDNGIGIDPQYADRIFEMFKRMHGEKEYPGTGIGLAFCKKVVELNGGKIWVDSAPGRGSTFFFTYPKNGEDGNET